MKMIKFFFILIIVFVLVCLVMNQSIFSYIEQKYHFTFYPKNDILQEANGFKNKLEQIRAILSNEPLPQNIEENIMVQEDMDELNASNDFIDKNTTIEDIQQTEDENVSFIDNTKLEVHKGDEFLFIGDSLM